MKQFNTIIQINIWRHIKQKRPQRANHGLPQTNNVNRRRL